MAVNCGVEDLELDRGDDEPVVLLLVQLATVVPVEGVAQAVGLRHHPNTSHLQVYCLVERIAIARDVVSGSFH